MKAKQSKRKARSGKDTMRAEYDFTGGVRGKHAARFAAGSNIVLLEPDVYAVFRTSEEVNETLRAVAGILQRRKQRSSRKTA
jgi:hypothetical protein